jgi:hypothetical protein
MVLSLSFRFLRAVSGHLAICLRIQFRQTSTGANNNLRPKEVASQWGEIPTMAVRYWFQLLRNNRRTDTAVASRLDQLF